MASEIKVDTISEKTSAGGVTIDGLLIKDGGISGDVSLIGTTPTFTIGDAGAEDAALVFDGNAQDYYIALDDSADDLLIGLGSTVGTTPAISIDENLAIKTYGDITMTGTTPVLTIGDAGAEDTAIVFDGNAKDFYIALDDSADKLVIGEGSTVGTNSILTITDDSVTVGDAAAVDTKIVFDGNAQDYHIGLDDSADTLVLGLGSTLGTTPAMTVNSSQVVTFAQNPVFPDGGVAVADLDIDGATDIGADIADADLFIIDDGAGGTNRKTAASRLKTYVGGGITNASMWRVTSTFTGNADPIDSNLALMSGDGYASLGSDMTESSGVFTFPSTGFWNIFAHFQFHNTSSSEGRYSMGAITTTTDNSTYSNAIEIYSSSFESDSTATSYGATGSFVFDVTNTTNCKCRFRVGHADTGTSTTGHGSHAYTHFIFTRLGDTQNGF